MKKGVVDKVRYEEVQWTDYRRSVARSARDAIDRNKDVWNKGAAIPFVFDEVLWFVEPEVLPLISMRKGMLIGKDGKPFLVYEGRCFDIAEK